MADKRIHELATTTDKSGKFLALDEAGLSEALKFSADSLIDKAFTDTLYVKLAGNETVNGVKTWNNQGVFEAGILVNLLGIDVTGNSTFNGTLNINNTITVTAGGIIVTGASSIAGKLTVSTGGFEVTGNSTIHGTLFQNGGTYGITLSSETLIFSRGSTNYIHAATVGGNLVFITNGQAKDPANANLVLSTTQESYFNNNLGIGVSDPINRLHVHKSDRPYIKWSSDTTGALSGDGTVLGFANADGEFQIRNKEAQHIVFLTTDAERMRVEAGGNVGIGTAAPSSILHIDGGSFIFQSDSGAGAGNGELSFGSTSKILILKNGYATDAARIHFDMSFGSIMTMKRSGEVGIGTDNPTRLLHVLSTNAATNDIAFFKGANASFDRLIIDTTNDVDCQLSFMGQGSTKWSLGNKGSTDAFIISKGFGAFGSSDFLTILTTGFVGISTTTPGSTLHVLSANSDVLRLDRSSTGAAGILFQNNSGNAQIFGCGFSGKGFTIRPDIGDTLKDVVINDLGNVGIATAAPTTKLQIDGTIAAPVNLRISNTGGSWGIGDVIGKYSFHTTDASGIGARDMASIQGISSVSSTSGNGTLAFFTSLSGTAMTEKMRIVGSGLIGSGLIIPTYQLDIQTIGATDAYVARFYNDYINKLSGGIIVRCGPNSPQSSPNVSAITFEDGDGTSLGIIGWSNAGLVLVDSICRKKYKKNIRKAKGLVNATALLKTAQPKFYNWKGRNEKEEAEVIKNGDDQNDILGFVIDDFMDTIPDAISTMPDPKDPDNEIIGYSPTAFIKYLVKAVEELSERLEILETP